MKRRTPWRGVPIRLRSLAMRQAYAFGLETELPRFPVLQGCPAIQSCEAAPLSNLAGLPHKPRQAKRGVQFEAGTRGCPVLQCCVAAPFGNVCCLSVRCETTYRASHGERVRLHASAKSLFCPLQLVNRCCGKHVRTTRLINRWQFPASRPVRQSSVLTQ